MIAVFQMNFKGDELPAKRPPLQNRRQMILSVKFLAAKCRERILRTFSPIFFRLDESSAQNSLSQNVGNEFCAHSRLFPFPVNKFCPQDPLPKAEGMIFLEKLRFSTRRFSLFWRISSKNPNFLKFFQKKRKNLRKLAKVFPQHCRK